MSYVRITDTAANMPLNSSKAKRELGISPAIRIKEGLVSTERRELNLLKTFGCLGSSLVASGSRG